MTSQAQTSTMPADAAPRVRPVAQALGSPLGMVAAAMGALGFVLYFWPWFYRQHQFSWDLPEDWGHAYVIPLISGYMLWSQRERLVAIPIKPFVAGLPAVALGMVGFLFFTLNISNHMLQGACMVLSLYGMVLTAFGPEMARATFLPVSFLSFGVTISQRIMQAMTLPLQILASKGAWVLLGLTLTPFGYSIEIAGNTLEIFDKTGVMVAPLNVAEACSGMRMLIAFYALAGAVSLLSMQLWWQRVLLMMLAAPVALLMNIVRVAVLGILTLIDPALAAGDAHTLIGTILLVPSLGLFLAVRWALLKMVADKPKAKTKAKTQATAKSKASGKGSSA